MKRFVPIAAVLLVVAGILRADDRKSSDGVALFRATRIQSQIVLSSNGRQGDLLPELTLMPIAVIEAGRWVAPPSLLSCTEGAKWSVYEKKYLHRIFVYHMGSLRGLLALNIGRGSGKSARYWLRK